MHRGIVLAALALSATAFAQGWQALPKSAPAPADNPLTAEKIALGKALYFDPRLSVDDTISCASCHDPRRGGDDGSPFSLGVKGQKGGRNAPTVLNAGFHSVQFWDGRAKSLEEQALGPIANPVEMGMSSAEAAAAKLRAIPGYLPLFEAAFGPGPVVTTENIGKAIASYERTLVTADSAYDKFARGNAYALPPAARKGMDTFVQTGCATCHMGPNFDGPQMPAGVGFYMRFPTYPESPYVAKYHLDQDLGRFQATGAEADKHLFRVPTLRNVEHTAPYFHNGSVAKLEDAIRVMASTQLNKKLSEVEVREIAAFLRSLSGTLPDERAPKLPPSPPRSEGRRATGRP